MKTVTNTVARIRTVWSAAALTLALGGCAATGGPPQEGDVYGSLSGGGSSVAYSTAFPVGSPEEAYRNGDAALRAGDSDRALFEYLRGLRMEERPKADPLYRVGIIHHGRGNHELAGTAYRWVLDIESNHAGAGTALGIILIQQRDYEQAERYLAPIVARRHAPWQAHNALGVIADINADHAAAQAHYARALEVSPRTPLVLNNQGYSRYLAGDLAGARQSLRQAVSVNPDYDLAWRNLGLVHAREGDYDTAIEAVARSGDRAKAYNDIGYISMLEGRYQDAMGFFEEAMRLSPAYYVTASENARSLNQLIRRHGGEAIN
ncbi:tetratricopeptide repeat protein [Billgrantia antri]|uniref:Tetratricopeptide repeat protein n=1 Tax=Halomonas sulfidivorans TaxID=2733488 RepID=A0ABX7WDX6_9GAMM|nr:tetratricopeptide repeat protein [Halomonas sulfidivorans]QTP58611.1 tetratricopeptide repeat protein [Halomonas sulfidivorans]